MKGLFGVSISAEMKGILLSVTCTRPPNATVQPVTQWGVFQATLAVELHILFVIDIGVELQYQTETRLNDGKRLMRKAVAFECVESLANDCLLQDLVTGRSLENLRSLRLCVRQGLELTVQH